MDQTNIVDAIKSHAAANVAQMEQLAAVVNGCVEISKEAEAQINSRLSNLESESELTSAPKKRGRPKKTEATETQPKKRKKTETTATSDQPKKRGRKATPGQVLDGVDLSDAKNKSDAAKIVFAAHPEAAPKDVLATCAAAGIELTAGLVSAIKSGIKNGTASAAGTTGHRGRPKKKKGTLPLPAIVQTVLSETDSGLKLDELVSQVVDNGYEYSGPERKNSAGWRKAVAQNVYQCCYDLMKSKTRRGWEGEEPIILRDDTSKRYMLNTAAKKAA